MVDKVISYKSKFQLVINCYNNLKNDVETKISQKSPVLPILFLIYINEVFKQVKNELFEIMSLSFVNEFRFIASKTSVKKIAKILEKVGNQIVKWEEKNAITYNMAKIKLILFF